MATLGDLIIKIGGNIDGYKAAMVEASTISEQFTGKITATVGEGIALFDAYGRAVEKAVPPTENLERANATLAASAERVIVSLGGAGAAAEKMAESSGHAVTEVQAVSGAIRTLDGNGGIRAAERFIASVLGFGPAFQAIFSVVGAIALTEVLVRMAEAAYHVAQNFLYLKDAEDDALEVGKQLAGEAERALEHTAEMHVQSLRDQGRLVAAAKEEQQNLLSKSIKLPDLTDKKHADKLGGIIGGIDSGELRNLQNVYSDLVPSEIPARIKEINEGLARTNHEMELAEKNGGDPLTAHFGSQAKVANELYASALQFLQIKHKEFAAEYEAAGSKVGKAQEDEAKRAEESARRQAEAIARGDEEQLAVLKASHQLSVGETIAFWKAKLAVESENAERSRQIQITLGNLYQEQDKVFQQIHERALKVQEERAAKAQKLQAFLSQMVVEGNALAEKIGKETADARTAGLVTNAKSNEQGEQAAGTFKKLDALRQYDAQLDHSIAAQIRLAQAELAADDEMAESRIRLLQIEQNLAETQKEKDEKGLALQQAIIASGERHYQQQIRLDHLKREGSLGGQLENESRRIPGAIGSSAAAAIFSGKNIGQEIAHSLKGIGQQMLGSVFNKLISTMLTQIGTTLGLTTATGVHTGVMTAHAGVMLSHLGVMVAHALTMVANTAATIANTIATLIKAFLGFFADGGSPPVGVPSIVGERGPELFIPKQAGTIIPNHMLNFRPTGAAGSVSSSTVHNGGNAYINIHEANNPRRTLSLITRHLKLAGGPVMQTS